MKFRAYWEKHPSLVVLIALLASFAILTPWGQFIDPDAFYHAHISALMLERGPLQSFPWLDLTSFDRYFADHHYLYHIVLGPAIAVFGAFRGTQVMALFLAALAGYALWNVLRSLGWKWRGTGDGGAWIFLVLVLLVPNFTARLLAAKASPLAIGFFIIVVGAMLFQRPGQAAFAGILFALSHGGWIIGIAAALLMTIAEIIGAKTLNDKPWKQSIRSAPWRTLFALLIGTGVGLLLHPNRSTLLQFLWLQVVEIGVFPRLGTVIPGKEWFPADPTFILSELAPLLIALLIILAGLLFASRSADDAALRLRYKRAIVLAFPVALTFALTIKNQRFIEYLAPALAFSAMSLWALVDYGRFKNWVKTEIGSLKPIARRTVITLFIALALALPIHHGWAAWKLLHRNKYPFDVYRATFSEISKRANTGDRVFSQWDEFPMLWAADDRLRYVSGLDPTFLHDANPVLSDAVRNLVIGQNTTTAWETIVEQTGSKYVFVTTNRYPVFDETLRKDERFTEIARDDRTATYEVTDYGLRITD